MKTIISAAVAATMFAGVAIAHPSNEPHVCDIDPASVLDYPGYAGKQGVWYDRGDYFFGFETKRFLEPVAYKSWSRVEGITTHYRVYKADCRVSEIEIVHTESKDEVENAGTVGVGSDRIVFSVSDDYQEIRVTYQGETLTFPIDLDEEFNEEFIDSMVSQLNQGAVDGSVATINDPDQTGSSSYDFTDQDALFAAFRNEL